jgi:hypothetical protein
MPPNRDVYLEVILLMMTVIGQTIKAVDYVKVHFDDIGNGFLYGKMK